jgi:hypothetical protein
MPYRGSIFDGILRDDGLRGRMKALADRGRRLARGYVARPSRRARTPAPAGEGSPWLRPVTVKLIYHDRARGALPNTTAALATYIAKEGPLFDRNQVGIDPRAVAEEWSRDRRVFHVIVSPDDGWRLHDMVGYARSVLEAWEARIGPLDWVASVERKPDAAHPQGNRHLHVMIRGVQQGCDLVLPERTVTRELRLDAMEAATDRLGWMDERERRDYERRVELARERRELERGRERDPGPDRGEPA